MRTELDKVPTGPFPTVIGLVVILLAAISLAPAVSGAPVSTPAGGVYISAAGSRVVVKGRSTLHHWSASSTSLNGRVVFTGHRLGKGSDALQLKLIRLSIPVTSLKGSDGSGMTHTIYHSLHSRQHPNITFILTGASLNKGAVPHHGSKTFIASGLLKVNGIMRAVKLTLSITFHPGGKATIQTVAKLKMSEFGVKPPTAMFGIIRSSNAITVTATWQLVKQKPGVPR